MEENILLASVFTFAAAWAPLIDCSFNFVFFDEESRLSWSGECLVQGCRAVAPGYRNLHHCMAPPHRRCGARVLRYALFFIPRSFPWPIINLMLGLGLGLGLRLRLRL